MEKLLDAGGAHSFPGGFLTKTRRGGYTAAMTEFAAVLRGGLIVSCQALPGEALFGADVMARVARAAEQGGAAGIRANSPPDIAAIREVTSLPIIGLWKVDLAGFDVYITPSVLHARAVAGAGADIIAVDATERSRPEGADAGDFIRMVREATGKPVLADVSTLDEGLRAANAGAAFVSTTMSGYTAYSPPGPQPDFALVRSLAGRLSVPVIAEGRISRPEEARAALDAGAWAVIVGGAITRPRQITERFVAGLA